MQQNSEAPAGVASPCVRNCCLDDQDICMGCGRTLQEILDWSASSPSEKQAIRQRSEIRKEKIVSQQFRRY